MHLMLYISKGKLYARISDPKPMIIYLLFLLLLRGTFEIEIVCWDVKTDLENP